MAGRGGPKKTPDAPKAPSVLERMRENTRNLRPKIPVEGGGTNSGSLDLRQYRGPITGSTVGQQLANDLLQIDMVPRVDKDGNELPSEALQQYAERFRQVYEEHSRSPGEGTILPYAEALHLVATKDPGKAILLKDAIGLADEKLKTFTTAAKDNREVLKKVRSLSGESKEAFQDAKDITTALEAGRQVAQERVGMEGVMDAPAPDFDASKIGRDLTRNLKVLEQKYPEIRDLIASGLSSVAAPAAPNVSGTRQGMTGFTLGEVFHAKEGKKRLPGSVPRSATTPKATVNSESRGLFGQIKEANIIRALAQITGLPFTPVLPGIKTTRLPDRPVALQEAFKILSAKGRWGAAAPLRQNPAWNPRGNNVDAQGKPIPQFLIPESVAADVRSLLANQDVDKNVVLEKGTNDYTFDQDRAVLNAQRTPLQKMQERLVAMIGGERAGVPRRLREAMGAKSKDRPDWLTDELIYRLEKIGRTTGIYPLDEAAAFHRAYIPYRDPVNDNLYIGPMPPQILGEAISNQLLLDHGGQQAMSGRMQPLLRDSMDVYNDIPALMSGKMRHFIDEETLRPKLFAPPNYQKRILESYQRDGLPQPPAMFRPHPLRPSPEELATARNRVFSSPIAALIG